MYENYPTQYPYVNPYSGMTRQPQQVMPQPQSNTFVPVSSETEARNYLVSYGNSVMFKDENAPYIYTKTAFSQMENPVFKRYRLVEESAGTAHMTVENTQGIDLSTYATKDEIQALQKELQALKSALGEGEKA